MCKILVSVLTLLLLSSCDFTKSTEKTITVKGSDTMVNLAQKWAENYMLEHTDYIVQVNGGGSGTGIAALFNGTANIATISRNLTSREKVEAARLGVKPNKITVAMDGIAIVVHKDNVIDSITILQLKKIYSGELRMWSDIGGQDEQIVLYGRENSSGTYKFFKDKVLNTAQSKSRNEFHSSTRVLQGTAALGEAVSHNINAIGYGGVGYFFSRDDLKILHIRSDDNSAAISPVKSGGLNTISIQSGEYPLSRSLYCYTNGVPDGFLSDFVRYIKSSKGQSIVAEMKYVPVEVIKREKE